MARDTVHQFESALEPRFRISRSETSECRDLIKNEMCPDLGAIEVSTVHRAELGTLFPMY